MSMTRTEMALCLQSLIGLQGLVHHDAGGDDGGLILVGLMQHHTLADLELASLAVHLDDALADEPGVGDALVDVHQHRPPCKPSGLPPAWVWSRPKDFRPPGASGNASVPPPCSLPRCLCLPSCGRCSRRASARNRRPSSVGCQSPPCPPPCLPAPLMAATEFSGACRQSPLWATTNT